MPPSKRRSRRDSSPTQDENQGRIKVARKSDDAAIKHKYADDEAIDDLGERVRALPQLDECKKLLATEMDECVVEAMRYVLAQNRVKPMVPIASAGISKILKDLNVRAAGTTKHVMARARVSFLRMGWDLVETGAGYLLRSFLPFEFRTKHLLGKQEISMHSVRLMVSMYLHTNGGKANSDALRSFLDRFGLKVSLKRQHETSEQDLERNEEQFGAENPINLLVEQKFLKKVEEKDLDGGTDEVYSMGDAQTGAACECPEEDMQGYLKELMAI